MSRRRTALVSAGLSSALLVLGLSTSSAIADPTLEGTAQGQQVERVDRAQQSLAERLAATSQRGTRSSRADTERPLTFGAPQYSILQTIDDVDIWSITVPKDGYLAVVLDQLPADYDLYVALPDGEIIGSSESEGLVPEQLEGELPAGTYYAVVVPYDTPDPEQPYRLTAEFEADATAPAAPQVTLGLANQRITATWTDGDDNGSDITGHVVQVATDGGGWVTTTPNAPGASFTFDGQPGHTYAVRVAAINAAGASDFSVPAQVSVPTPPPVTPPVTKPTPAPTTTQQQVTKPATPTALTVKALPKGKVSLRWKGVTGAKTYSVEVYKAGKWQTLKTTSATALNTKIAGVKRGSKVKLRVRAGNTAGFSNYVTSRTIRIK